MFMIIFFISKQNLTSVAHGALANHGISNTVRRWDCSGRETSHVGGASRLSPARNYAPISTPRAGHVPLSRTSSVTAKNAAETKQRLCNGNVHGRLAGQRPHVG